MEIKAEAPEVEVDVSEAEPEVEEKEILTAEGVEAGIISSSS